MLEIVLLTAASLGARVADGAAGSVVRGYGDHRSRGVAIRERANVRVRHLDDNDDDNDDDDDDDDDGGARSLTRARM